MSVMKKLMANAGLATGLVLGLAFTGAAGANPISLYNTGVDGSGNVLSGGSQDAHWLSGGQPTYVLSPGNQYSSWVPDDTTGAPGSAWIEVCDCFNTPATPYTFTQTFSLTGLDPLTAVITGRWYIDDIGTLSVNGNLIDSANDSFGGRDFSVPVAFLAGGLNTIDVTMTSDDLELDGIRQSFNQATADALPLPAALPLFAGAFGALGLLGWRSKRANAASAA